LRDNFRAKLSKEGLQQLSPEERRLFLSLGHIANEIKALQKLLVWSSNFSTDHEPIVHGRISFSLMLLKILAGKLNEAHEAIRKSFYNPEVSRSYAPKLFKSGRDDDLGAFRRLIQETLSIAGLVNDFAEAFMLEFIGRHRDSI
jgi:hypothetical protein